MENILKKIKKLEKENGKFDDAILIDDAHHACNPARDHEWTAQAIFDKGDGTFDLGWVKWDFEEWIEEENGGEGLEDAGGYPWEEKGEFKAESEECTDKEEIENWID